MIPKIIHYCWFGRKPIPKSALKCISSWRKFFPDYEIKEWNEDNFDVHSIPYIHEAYECGKYAFVSDYARFWVLYHYGGIYFDTDVEVIRPMNDIIKKGNFMGREAGAFISAIIKSEAVNPGLGLGVVPGLAVIEEILSIYRNIHFLNKDGSLNLKTIVRYTTEILANHGLNNNNQDLQLVADIWIYPTDYFCPMDHTKANLLNITDRTVSIHHYDCSWLDKKSINYFLHILKGKMAFLLGSDFVYAVCNILKRRS